MKYLRVGPTKYGMICQYPLKSIVLFYLQIILLLYIQVCI